MSWRTSAITVRLRRLGRRMGLTRIVAGFAGGRQYEEKFRQAMLNTIRPGDIIWDVGANVGHYSTVFSDMVGSIGRVFAYEPSPHNRRQLQEAVASRNNVVVIPVALGDNKKTVYLQQGTDSIGATSRISSDPSQTARRVAVEQQSGDDMIASGDVAAPTVIKIDTEGSELDVMRGLEKALKSRNLRSVCIEVHFQLLDERGVPDAPSTIERMLTASEFHVTWPDPSHIVATRATV